MKETRLHYTDYPKPEDCKNGYLYRIFSRNLDIGVYVANIQGFIGIRTKFGERFLNMELHWDADQYNGTAKPKEELEPCPIKGNIDDYAASLAAIELDVHCNELYQWLLEKEKEYNDDANKDNST